MTDDEWRDFIAVIKANVRPHAGYFAWPTDRTLEEYGAVESLHESLSEVGEGFFHSYEARGEGNDPPDCEALSLSGHRIGIEVTELVDGDAIGAAKAGHPTNLGPLVDGGLTSDCDPESRDGWLPRHVVAYEFS